MIFACKTKFFPAAYMAFYFISPVRTSICSKLSIDSGESDFTIRRVKRPLSCPVKRVEYGNPNIQSLLCLKYIAFIVIVLMKGRRDILILSVEHYIHLVASVGDQQDIKHDAAEGPHLRRQ